MDLKYMTPGLPGVGGRIRVEMEDFQVEETLPFQASGDGEHYLLFIEKRGISTLDVIRELSGSLGIGQARFGYGGLKDARAIARQYFSIWSLQDLTFFDLPGIHVLEAKRHNKKLKPGTLRSNTFRIVVRDTDHEERADAIMEALAQKGVPNYFGPQRFGSRRPNTHIVGEKIVRGDIEGAVRSFVGNPFPTESPDLQEARKKFDDGDLEGALELFPEKFYQEKYAIRALLNGGDYLRALKAIPLRLRRLFVHAFQSDLFNKILDQRMDHPEPMEGDILSKGMPTGPLFGFHLDLARGAPGEIEKRILEESGVSLEDFRCPKTPELRCEGDRHALFFKVQDCLISHNPLILSFTLPKGCYATSVLREVMKNDAAV